MSKIEYIVTNFPSNRPFFAFLVNKSDVYPGHSTKACETIKFEVGERVWGKSLLELFLTLHLLISDLAIRTPRYGALGIKCTDVVSWRYFGIKN